MKKARQRIYIVETKFWFITENIEKCKEILQEGN